MKPMVYKIITVDLDGTILKRKKQMNEEDIDALKSCLNRGMYVYIVTGRPYFFARYIADKISSEVKVVSSNGGCYELNGQIIERPIDKETLDKVIDILSENGVHAFYKNNTEIYTQEKKDERFTYDHYNQVEGFLYNESFNDLSQEQLKKMAQKVDKVLVYSEDKKAIVRSIQQLKLDTNLVLSSYNDISFEINSKGTSKGDIIKIIARKLGVSLNEIISFGDGDNDISLFKICGCSVAMGNACERVKAVADEITLDCEHAGVSFFLKNKFGG